jgi:TonB family protein
MLMARRRPRPHKISKMNEKSLSDRILGWSLAASVVINLAWIALVSHSDLFGSASSFTQLHEKKIKVFKPIPQKPKPKKELPPPPPPKQKPPPKIKPLKQIKPLPPRPTPRPTPPVPTHTIKVASSNRTVSTLTTPVVPENTGPVTPVVPSYTPAVPVQAPPVQAPPVQAPPVQAPPVQAPSEPKPVALVKPAPVVEKPKPPGWVPIETQEADFPTPSVDIDASEGASGTVIISFTIDEKGRARHVRVKQGCGVSEVDEKCANAVRQAQGTAAVQDHIPRDASYSVTFNIGG